MNKKVVFFHIPKTGGTSLHNILISQFKKEKICPERFNNLKKYSKDKLLEYDFFSGHFDKSSIDYIPMEKDIITLFREPKSRILSLYYFWKSHTDDIIKDKNLVGPRIAKKLTLLEFLRYKRDGIPGNINNIITRSLIGSMYVGPKDEFIVSKNNAISLAKRMIDNELAVFGIMEYFEKSCEIILSYFNLPMPDVIPHLNNNNNRVANTLEKKVEKELITKEIEYELDRLTETDHIIYEHALNRFKEKYIKQ